MKKSSRGNKIFRLNYSHTEFCAKMNISIRSFTEHFEKFINYYGLNKSDFKKNGEEKDDYNWDIEWADLAALLISTFSENPFFDYRNNLKSIPLERICRYYKLLLNKIDCLPIHIKKFIMSTDSYYYTLSLVDHFPLMQEKLFEFILVTILCHQASGGDIFKPLLSEIDRYIYNYFDYYCTMEVSEYAESIIGGRPFDFNFNKSSLDWNLIEHLKFLMHNSTHFSSSYPLLESMLNESDDIEIQREKYFRFLNKNYYVPNNQARTAVLRLNKYEKYTDLLEIKRRDIKSSSTLSIEEKKSRFEMNVQSRIHELELKVQSLNDTIGRLKNLEYSNELEHHSILDNECYIEFYKKLEPYKTNPNFDGIKESIDMLLSQFMINLLKKDENKIDLFAQE